MTQKRVSATIQVTAVIDGENSIRIDLDNQQDIISLDGEGKVRFARTIVVHARIFDGQKKATTGVALDGTESSLRTALTIGDCTPTIFFSQGILTVTWQFAKGMSATAVNKTIALLYNDIRHDATFTLATTDAEILYQLRPSPSEVSFSINEDDNSFTPASVFLTCGYVKETGSGKTVYDNPNASRIDSSNYLYYRTRTGNAWGNWQSYSQALRVASTTEVTDYEFCISSASSAAGVSDSNITDAEVVPVVRGGKNGDGIKKVTRSYAVSSVGSVASDTTEPEHHGSWSSGSPAVSEQYPYLWCREVTEYKYAAAVTRYFLVGARGNNGVDAQDIEWAYIRTKNYVAPEIYSDSNYTDSNGRTYTADDHLPRVNGSGRSDIEKNGGTSDYPQCTDDPQGVDDTWKFEWEIKREKGSADSTTGKRNWEAYSGKMKLHNNLAESALVIDLSNDSDQFGTDSTSKVLSEQTRTTDVQMLYGTEEQEITAVPTYRCCFDDGTTVDSSIATVSVGEVSGTNKKKYRVTVVIKATPSAASVMPMAAHNGIYVDITATCAKDTRTIRFTLEKVMGGAPGDNPVIYQLSPTLKSLSFNRDGDNNLTPASRDVTVNVLVTEGNTTKEKTAAIDGITYDWGFDNEPKQNINAMAVGSYFRVDAADAAAHSHVWLKLSKGDTETLPIVKDGIKGQPGSPGEDAAKAYATPEVITIPCNEDGSVAGIIERSIIFSMKAGSHSASLTGVTAGTRPTGVATEAVSANAVKITIDTSATAAGMAGGVTFTVIGSYGGKSYSVPVTVGLIGALKGAQGQSIHGDPGKICYIAGEYNDEITYTSNDEQTVAVEVDNGGETADVYYLEAKSNVVSGSHIAPTDYGQTVWKKGLSNYNLIRTRYLFADFGHLASFIMRGDWMISQYGTLKGAGGTDIVVDASNADREYRAVTAVVLNGNSIHNGLIVCKVALFSSIDTTVTITITPSSEPNYDFGAVGRLGDDSFVNATAASIRSGTGCLLRASGTTPASVTVPVTKNESKKYFYIAYAKDASDSYGNGNDNATFEFKGIGIGSVTKSSATSGMTHEVKEKASVPFGWFDPSDPIGTSGAVGYKFMPNYAVDGLTGHTYQHSAYVSGEIHAGSGSIGGFDIGEDDLTNSNYDAGITIRDVYDRKSVQIGADAEDTMTGRKAAMVAKATEYNTSDSDRPYNTALFLDARYATYNYAFHGYGNGVLEGYMQGFKVYSFTATSATNPVQLRLGDGMIQAITSVTVPFALIRLPKLGEIKRTLSITDNRNFCCQLIIINQSPIGVQNTAKIIGDISSSRSYKDSVTADDALPAILRGTDENFLDLGDRINAYFFITYINTRFIANYIDK